MKDLDELTEEILEELRRKDIIPEKVDERSEKLICNIRDILEEEIYSNEEFDNGDVYCPFCGCFLGNSKDDFWG